MDHHSDYAPLRCPPGEAAIRLAARGYRVFPVKPGGKAPLTKNGFHDATTSQDPIAAWWSRDPSANIGLATGRISGVVVLDVDPGHGGDESLADLERAHGPLPETVEAITGGGGRHLYFRAPSQAVPCSASRIGRGLDVRGDGGYVVVPPSIHASGSRYAWIEGRDLLAGEAAEVPSWLLGLLGPLTFEECAPSVASACDVRAVTSSAIAEGQRHTTLMSLAGSMRNKGLDGEAILAALVATNRSRCEPPLPTREVEEIARSAGAYPLSGGIRSRSFASACRVLRDERLSKKLLYGPLAFDEFGAVPTIGGEPVRDSDVDVIRERVEREVRLFDSKGAERGVQFTHEEMARAVHVVARERAYHPVRDYLRGLVWDGVPRIDTELPLHARLGGDPLAATLLRRWLIAAVARALRPGCKVDAVLVLVGQQGTYKSSFFRVMAGAAWFSDTAVSINDKDAFLALRRVWILEWAELESMARARDAAAVKAFLSSNTDKYRPPYGREPVEVPRSCVIVGSTNDVAFLTDPTGNRRYWTVRVLDPIDIKSIEAIRDQLWAEALHAFTNGEPWHLTPREEALLADQQRAFEVADPWEDAVLNVARLQPLGLSTADLLDRAVGKKAENWSKADEMRVTAILKRAGYSRRSLHRGRIWIPPAATAATPSIKTHVGEGERRAQKVADQLGAVAAPARVVDPSEFD